MQNLYRTAAVVTVFSALEHCLGFLYRIVLSRILGPEGLGVYQVSLTVFAVFLTVTSSGLPVTLSRIISKHRAHGHRRGEQAATSAAIVLTLAVSLPLTAILFLVREPFSRIFSDPRCADLFYILLIGLSFTSVYSVLRGCFWGNRRFFIYSLVELIEEIVRIAVGVFLLLLLPAAVADVNLAAIAVLVSYLCSFCVALIYFFVRGGRLRSPRGEFLPLLRASLPVTAMRASSSLVNSFISVLFPMRLMAAGVSSARAMSEYGVVYGMVMPVLMIPSTLIGSIALVLVPELSECFYRGQKEKLSALVEKALNAALLIAGMLFPFFVICGEDVGAMLYASAASGRLISACAIILLPMSVTMISTSILNSIGCEKHTLFFFLFGAAAMLLNVWFLPKYLGSGALCLGMACDYTISAVCALALLRKKTGKLGSWKYFLKLSCAVLPVIGLGYFVRKLLATYLSYIPALALTVLFIGCAEVLLFSLLKLLDVKALLRRFFAGKKSIKKRA